MKAEISFQLRVVGVTGPEIRNGLGASFLADAEPGIRGPFFGSVLPNQVPEGNSGPESACLLLTRPCALYFKREQPGRNHLQGTSAA